MPYMFKPIFQMIWVEGVGKQIQQGKLIAFDSCWSGQGTSFSMLDSIVIYLI